MSNEVGFQRAARALRARLDSKQPRREIVRALAGMADGLIETGQPRYIYARLQGDESRLVRAYNPGFALSADRPIDLLKRFDALRVVGYDVLGFNNDVVYPNDEYQGAVDAHHLSHELRGDGSGGWDALNVYSRMIVPIRANAQTPPDLTVYVQDGFYDINGPKYFEGGSSPVFTPPSTDSKYDVVVIDSNGVISIIADGFAFPPPFFSIPTDVAPIAIVLLSAGQTSILEMDIIDARMFLSRVTAESIQHDLLSATHPDTVAASPVVGDLIVGTVSGWQRLPVGQAGYILSVVGGTPTYVPSGASSGHVHALERWVASAAQTDFLLPDLAEYLELVSDDGLIVDPQEYTLSADYLTVVFASGRTLGAVIVATYVVLSN